VLCYQCHSREKTSFHPHTTQNLQFWHGPVQNCVAGFPHGSTPTPSTSCAETLVRPHTSSIMVRYTARCQIAAGCDELALLGGVVHRNDPYRSLVVFQRIARCNSRGPQRVVFSQLSVQCASCRRLVFAISNLCALQACEMRNRRGATRPCTIRAAHCRICPQFRLLEVGIAHRFLAASVLSRFGPFPMQASALRRLVPLADRVLVRRIVPELKVSCAQRVLSL
jgi:hypothetical protein